jgi:large subunit ribosomal protein L22
LATVETPQREVRAEARYVRAAPRKAQLVAEQIRGRTVPEARTILAFTSRDAARDVEKVLNSAVANAETNHGLVGDEMVVSAAFVGAGPTLKRWRARARGRVARIKKRTCHITIQLVPLDGSEVPEPRQAAVAAPEAPAPEEEPKPKRAPRRKAEAAEAAEKPEAEEMPEAEEKPKTHPSRTAKPKAEAAAAEEKPKPRRTRAAKPAAETADKPKRTTRRKKSEEDS